MEKYSCWNCMTLSEGDVAIYITFYLIFLTALLRCNSNAIKFSSVKCKIQSFLVQCQSCVAITTI